MNKKDFESYITQHIPITAAMGLSIEEFSKEKIVISAPLNENINHRDSAFGGSIVSLLIMTAWSRVYQLLMENNLQGMIVIQSCGVNFIEPIVGDFISEIIQPDQQEIDKFIKMLIKFRKARIELSSHIKKEEKVLAKFTGSFVVIEH